MSNKAASFAVLIAFFVGIVGSLSLRPINQNTPPADASTNSSPNQTTRINWRVPTVFQKTMPVIGENPVFLADSLKSASNGAIHLEIFDPGEIVPAFSITDAVRDRKVVAGYTWLGYDQGKIAASPLIAAVPFGMEPWEYSAWWYNGGGREITESLYVKYEIHPIYCGMTGPETAGWFRERINSLDDVKGLKIRFAGLGGQIIERLGASVTMLPGGEIFQALEKGAIDATEFALPIVDQALGFSDVAKYNYYPGWHQPFTSSHLVINLDTWKSLTRSDKAIIEMACTAAVTRNLAHAEAVQGEIIANFDQVGVSAERLPLNLLKELKKVATQVIEEEAQRDADFAAVLASQKKFLANYEYWKSLAYLPRNFDEL